MATKFKPWEADWSPEAARKAARKPVDTEHAHGPWFWGLRA